MAKGSEYWQKRFSAVEDMNNKTARSTVHSVTTAFDKAQAQIETELNAWYARFAKNNEITLQEAKRMLTTRELKEFRWDVEEYIKYGRQNALDQKWLKELENASARVHVSRLEALKIRTQQAVELAYGNELDALDQMAARMYTDDYYHTAYEIQRGLGVGWDIGQIDQRKLKNVLSKPWTADKQTFSDRIWKSKTQLLDSLQTEFTQMCILGKAPDETIKLISQKMNVSKGQAGRLIMTEAAYFGSAAQKDCFNDLDVEKFEVVATLDKRTSETCQHMDGKVFDMKDFQIGVTAPPFHVWCRSCTAPWFEDNDDGERIARDADGNTYMVPADMKYSDWKKSFVDGGSKDNLKPASTMGVGNNKTVNSAPSNVIETSPKTVEKSVKRGTINQNTMSTQYKDTDAMNEYDFYSEDQELFRLNAIKELSGFDDAHARDVLEALCGTRAEYLRNSEIGKLGTDTGWFAGGDRAIRTLATEEAKRKAKLIHEYLMAAPKYDGVIYRGATITKEKIDSLKIGGIFEETGALSSWTTLDSVASGFAEARSDQYGKLPVIFQLTKTSYGSPVAHLSIFGREESEVLVSNMISDKFIIENITEKDGIVWVELKEGMGA